jgi:hypothetical protein
MENSRDDRFRKSAEIVFLAQTVRDENIPEKNARDEHLAFDHNRLFQRLPHADKTISVIRGLI